MAIRIIGDTKVDFIGKRKIAFVVSGILVLAGLVAVVMITLGRANLGIQFIGGTQLEGYFDKPVDIAQLRSALASGGFADAEILQISGREQPYFFLIRAKAEASGTQKAQSIIDALRQYFPDHEFHTDSVHEVGAAVGRTLQTQTRWAVVISLLGILAYITMRFDFRFGVAATIATFHDVLAVLAACYLMNMEITILVISSVLTLAGYSLTDTVIVYDRIRENLRKSQRKAEFIPAVNRSINEVLGRTMLTSLTVLVVVIALYVAGGPVLRDFSLVLIMGIIVGTYSSWFVASPIYVEWEQRKPKRFRS